MEFKPIKGTLAKQLFPQAESQVYGTEWGYQGTEFKQVWRYFEYDGEEYNPFGEIAEDWNGNFYLIICNQDWLTPDLPLLEKYLCEHAGIPLNNFIILNSALSSPGKVLTRVILQPNKSLVGEYGPDYSQYDFLVKYSNGLEIMHCKTGEFIACLDRDFMVSDSLPWLEKALINHLEGDGEYDKYLIH
jgi:hypothetical protein